MNGNKFHAMVSDLIGYRFAIVVMAAFVFPSASLMGLVGTYGALMFDLMVADAGEGYKLMIVTTMTLHQPLENIQGENKKKERGINRWLLCLAE